MQRLMAVQQCVAGIVCYKIDGDRVERHHVDNILAQSAELLRTHACDLERVPVKMLRVLIPTAVAKDHPVTPSLVDLKRFNLRPRLVVDGPAIEPGSIHRSHVAKGKSGSLIRPTPEGFARGSGLPAMHLLRRGNFVDSSATQHNANQPASHSGCWIFKRAACSITYP